MQNILNITLNNNWKNLAPLSLSPKPANTGLSSIVPMTIIAEAKETSFLRELSWNQIYCKELNNLYSGLSTRRYTETIHTYMKSKLFLYTSNNQRKYHRNFCNSHTAHKWFYWRLSHRLLIIPGSLRPPLMFQSCAFIPPSHFLCKWSQAPDCPQPLRSGHWLQTSSLHFHYPRSSLMHLNHKMGLSLLLPIPASSSSTVTGR